VVVSIKNAINLCKLHRLNAGLLRKNIYIAIWFSWIFLWKK